MQIKVDYSRVKTMDDIKSLMNQLREPVYVVGGIAIALPEAGQHFNSFNTVLEYKYIDDTRRVLLTSTDLDELIPLFIAIRALDPQVFKAIEQYDRMENSGHYQLLVLGFDRALGAPYIRAVLA